MGRFKFEKTNIPGVLEITIDPFRDPRGYFMEAHNQADFKKNGLEVNFIQDNESKSEKGTVRGLHYQINPNPMGKLVRCVTGRIFDVGVDVRKGSATFGQWVGRILSGENKKMFYFPPGIAHGFLCLEDDTYVYYKCTGLYSPKDERALLWNDPGLGIAWPLDQVKEVLVSDKDKVNPGLKEIEAF
ncbi:dTDP-4-dehydrorhamnose 3,5-epimerase [candidate division WOR-1 bacterium RIFOXYB2_FULL_42_35]|uniref:dTDP-4-dehydrorhamnose 3,5-epimerase n=1 Tax=candidate division WOR-1 bacterium RIFOXYC2_FULL_41_25 TaxID=1802586 RepID=A0A1F4TPC9_UNCSA|nr:MAG: dTDP-4-dehydrorhamnose 3,5-epimerase [candidate division WOR-1 bacterium RIFOXYB2_FULL_42_35]OGC24529.1 MAG: dTDP-4-dehydrorhamnose 3,5-epimerase [candidate division WOR-1 bacterium RIFOXYA2_FULL_41_14]OGC34574.1 MAG: dTDP-4-dehydrorhamnose 3,5-epimerase [candidate division WOR-1 bacterium RIFOXYC2_FULL_41_25]OGC43728.1 MAG: dTDP-4-dehydrorhamnose 3,5-epimerase [candidate division WOR-1 bacterium RIFOXYD2_FULL_41_8]